MKKIIKYKCENPFIDIVTVLMPKTAIILDVEFENDQLVFYALVEYSYPEEVDSEEDYRTIWIYYNTENIEEGLYYLKSLRSSFSNKMLHIFEKF